MLVAEGNYQGRQPELFYPGTDTFSIRFDGKKLTWIVITYEVNQKSSTASSASAESQKCKPVVQNSIQLNKQKDLEYQLSNKGTVYPNPTSNGTIIGTANPILSLQSLVVIDAAGSIKNNIRSRKLSATTVFIELSALPKGIYWIRIPTSKGYIVKRVVKQ